MAPMSNIVIGLACVLLTACDVSRPTPAERVHVVEVSQGDEVKSTTVPLHTVVHRRLTNAWSGSTASKLTAKDEGDRVQEAQPPRFLQRTKTLERPYPPPGREQLDRS